MTKSLPSKPSLNQLKHQAKDVLKAHRSGDTSACELLKNHHRFKAMTNQDIMASKVSLQEVQQALAKEYGFDSWVDIKSAVEEHNPESTVEESKQMKVAVLINDKESRECFRGSIISKGGTVDEYPTAAKALGMFGATRYDLIVIHWRVLPGLKPSDPKIRDYAAMIPVVKLNENALYWETALRVIDIIRLEESPNKSTPVVVVFPDLGNHHFDAGDRLTAERVGSDLSDKQPVRIISEVIREKIIEEVVRFHIT